jgi:hypothetical protein
MVLKQDTPYVYIVDGDEDRLSKSDQLLLQG